MGPVDAHYGIDGGHLLVWLDNRALAAREQAGSLCRRHADALSVPRGWTLEDRRADRPRLFVAESGDESGSPVPPEERVRPSRMRPVGEDRDVPSLFDVSATDDNDITSDPVPPVEDEPVSRPLDEEETAAHPWRPRLSGRAEVIFDGSDGMARPVFGRLLGRAFHDDTDADGMSRNREAG